MTLDDLKKVYDSLLECGPDEEDFGWGPSYEFAMKRRDNALAILKKAIENHLPKNTKCPNCGGNNYIETLSREYCPDCGMKCDYWSNGSNEVYDNVWRCNDL